MEQFEKIVKGLECRKNAEMRCGNPCEETGNCKYATLIRDPSGEPYYPYICDRKKLCEDAIFLIWQQRERIKELEAGRTARVMTLEEVLAHYSLPPVVLDDLGWQENYLQDIEPLYFDFPVENAWAVHWRGYQQVRKYLEDWRASYGQNWRCWTSQPTDEQREATQWAK